MKIKVQSNTLPSHCYGTSSIPNYPQESTVEFEVVWNKDVTNVLNYQESHFADAATTEATLCDINVTKKNNMSSSVAYSNISGSIDTWAGIALDNVAIFNALALGNLDAI